MCCSACKNLYQRRQLMIEEFWQKFLTTTGKDSTTKYADCFHFNSSEKAANGCLALVLAGKKKQPAQYEISIARWWQM